VQTRGVRAAAPGGSLYAWQKRLTRDTKTRRLLLGGAAATLTVLASCADPEPALARGDRLWADAQYDAALSEYRLAARGRDELALLRVAHAYVQLGQLERARSTYDQILQRHPQHLDQAVYDYIRLARHSLERNDRHGLAGAVEAARALRPDLPLDEFALPLARYYVRTRDMERALEFFERALGTVPTDSAPAVIYEIALLHEARGNCRDAIGYFEAYLRRPQPGPRAGEARWHIGNCSFQLARQAQDAGEIDGALTRLETVIRLGQPENLLDQAHFQRGELLFALDRRDEALEAYWRFLELTPTRSGALGEGAQRRVDQIRFGY
jgi:tetratricopeptide (TPR) repeat protein